MLSQRLKKLHPYVPGEQPDDREYIKLNANENAYPPHKSVTEAVCQSASMHAERLALYPDPDANMLRKSIADFLNSTGGVLERAEINPDGECSPAPQDEIPFTVTPQMIFCGNGSDEVLSFLFYTFFDSDRPLIMPEHTYSFYPVYCGFYDIPLKKIPLKKDWSLDMDAMCAAAAENKSAVIFANPNAPTGMALTREQVRDALKSFPQDRAFVVDEAYCDFGGESCIPLLKEFKNLVIVRTFSKSLSFAGMRLGYVVAAPELIDAMLTVKNSFNHFPVDFITQRAGIASCGAAGYYARTARLIAQERESFSGFLKERGWLVLDSRTNFVFAKKNGAEGKYIYESAKREGILIRHFDTPGIEDFVRITIGTPEQMMLLRSALENI